MRTSKQAPRANIRTAQFAASAAGRDNGQSKAEETAAHHAQTLYALFHPANVNARIFQDAYTE